MMKKVTSFGKKMKASGRWFYRNGIIIKYRPSVKNTANKTAYKDYF